MSTVQAIKPKFQRGVVLRGSTADEEFSTLDLVSGLAGICSAMDQNHDLVYAEDRERLHRLAAAAKVLSTMIRDRVE